MIDAKQLENVVSESHLLVDDHVNSIQNVVTDVHSFDLCEVYQAVRPVLNTAISLLFWKPKWKHALEAFRTKLDSTCPNIDK